jgi:hypothetical protein
MENFHKILGLILLLVPGIFVVTVGEGADGIIYPIAFFILFTISIIYHLWLFKKYGSSIPKNIKDTHRW